MNDLAIRFSKIVESRDAFPVDFDEAWKWVGYTQKGHALEMLKANFIDRIDFFRKSEKSAKIDSRISGDQRDGEFGSTLLINQNGGEFDFRFPENQKKTRGGDRKTVKYYLTVDCFKSFCMMAGTEQGRNVRRYFLDVEKKFFDLAKNLQKKLAQDSIRTRVDLTCEWREHGADKPYHYVNLTRKEYGVLFGDKTKKKAEMSKEERAELMAFESLETLKLIKNPDIHGYYALSDSVAETGGVFWELKNRLSDVPRVTHVEVQA